MRVYEKVTIKGTNQDGDAKWQGGERKAEETAALHGSSPSTPTNTKHEHEADEEHCAVKKAYFRGPLAADEVAEAQRDGQREKRGRAEKG